MSKKDYIKMARAFRSIWHDRDFPRYTNEAMFKEMIDRVAKVLQEDNPQFKRSVFFEAILGKDGLLEPHGDEPSINTKMLASIKD